MRNTLLLKINRWGSNNFSLRYRVLFVSCVIGLFCGIAAVLLKNAVYYTRLLITSGFNVDQGNWLYLIYPLIGLVLTVIFIQLVIKENITHGISRVLQAISRKKGEMERHDTYASIIGSSLTVGFGGSAGLEAPVVATGSAIGSVVGQWFRMDYRNLVLFIGCGTASAISSIFIAPIAGVIFALEVLMLDLTMTSVLPLLLSAITGAVTSTFLMGKEVLFDVHPEEPFHLWTIPFFMLLGLFSGFVSLYFNNMNYRIENIFGRFRNKWVRTFCGGVILSVMIFFFPSLYGEGYLPLETVLSGDAASLTGESYFYGFNDNAWLFTFLVLAIILLKVIATSVTTGSGGVGGVFAPSLFLGGLSGYFLAHLINLTGLVALPESHFALTGMAGLMAGVMHTPLTAIFLIAEITGGYELLIPLMITSAIAYLTAVYFEPHSIYTRRLAEKGILPSRNKDKTVLAQMKIDDLIEKNFNEVRPNDYLGDLVREVSRSQRNIFPVIDRDKTFHGIIFINDVRHIIFKQELWGKIFVKDLMYTPKLRIELGESMESVAQKFTDSDAYNIVVLDQGKYVGFISRANFFTEYRKLMKEYSDE